MNRSCISSAINRNRRIGVEHEFAVPVIGVGTSEQILGTIASILSANGLPACARSSSHRPVPPPYLFSVERDTSIQGEQRYHGITWHQVEIKTRVLAGYDEWEQSVPPMLEIMAYMGARTTSSCGTHVHVDLPEFNSDPLVVRSLYNLIYRYEPVLYRLLPPSRSNNKYCLPLPEIPGMFNGCRTHADVRKTLPRAGGRYRGLNLTHLVDASGPHVEIRYGAGTLDSMAARHWLRLTHQLVEHAITHTCQASERMEPSRQAVDRMLIATGFRPNSRLYTSVSDELRETARYMVLRQWKHFNSSEVSTVAGSAAFKEILPLDQSQH